MTSTLSTESTINGSARFKSGTVSRARRLKSRWMSGTLSTPTRLSWTKDARQASSKEHVCRGPLHGSPFFSSRGRLAKLTFYSECCRSPTSANRDPMEAGRNFTAVGGAVRNLLRRKEDRDGNSVAPIRPAGIVLLSYGIMKQKFAWVG